MLKRCQCTRESYHEDIGRIIGVRPGNVRVILSRALERLRRRLAPTPAAPRGGGDA